MVLGVMMLITMLVIVVVMVETGWIFVGRL